MVSNINIEKLLEKYDNGETSLKEEQQLRAYFAQDTIAPHLEPYRVMFQYFSNTKQETFSKDIPIQVKKRSYIYQWISVAAVIAIMFGIFTQFNGDEPKTFNNLTEEEQLVYTQTKEAFNLLSSKFNQGASNANVLGLVGTQFDKGADKVEYVSELSKTTNKILK
ncbi:MAG: hypothetical protein R2797_06940 [Gelidibacter sp.]